MASVLTAERLRELLDYDPETGVFRWRKSLSNRTPIGKIAGAVRADGYLAIRVFNKLYLGHRLAWLYVHGEWPADRIDHVNRDKTDNRSANLRPATVSQNGGNSHKPRTNTSGFKGVCWNKRAKAWVAGVKRDKQRWNLGYFRTPEEAHAAYCAAAGQVFGEFMYGGGV